MLNHERYILPRSLDNTGDKTLVGHFAKAEARQLELAQESARTPCELAPVAQTDRRRIFWHFIEGIDSVESLFDCFVHIENRLFQRLSSFPVIFYHSLALFLSCDLRFFCHLFPLLLAGRPFLALLPVGVFLIDYI